MSRYKLKPRFFVILIGLLVIAAGCLAFPLFSHLGDESALETSGKGSYRDTVKPKEEAPVSLRIACVGDVMVHGPQLRAQYDAASGSYDFSDNFRFIKPYIDQADLALCNLETTFAGGTYSGYPLFNAPESLADALVGAGFDVALTSNNHMMDKGFDGMQRTLTIARQAGLQTVGSRFEGEKRYLVVDVKGIKVGIISYTYETPGDGSGRKFINTIPVSDPAASLINSFSYQTLTEDMALVGQDIADARQDGAQLIVCYFHWGEEYQRSPNDWQQSIARQAADLGADVIFASHPHVLQGTEILTAPAISAGMAGGAGDAGKSGDSADASGSGETRQVPVFYSMGNFISNQRTETLKNRYTEQGLIAEVNLEIQKSTGKVLSVAMDAIPTWVDKYGSGDSASYAIVPLDSQMEQNEALRASGHLARAREALADVTALLGEGMIRRE